MRRGRWMLLALLALAPAVRAANENPRVNVALVPRRADDWRCAGVARATRSALARIPHVYPTNTRMARRIVPIEPRVSREKLSDAGQRLHARFVVIVDTPAPDKAEAVLVFVADPARHIVATHQPVSVQAPLHKLPGALALKLADAMHLEVALPDRARVARPPVETDAACEAVWRGDAETDPLKQHGFYARALELEPQAPLVHNRMGAVFARMEQFGSAVAAFNQATRLRNDYIAAYTNCGQALTRMKRWKEAEVVFRRAIALGPKSATPTVGLARLLDRVGGTVAAVDQLEEAIEVDPCHVDAMLTLTEYYFEQNNIRLAKEMTRRILALEPKHVETLNIRGLLHLADRSAFLAAKSFRLALDADPTSAESQANLGLALFAQHRPKEAVDALRKAIDMDRTSGKAHFYLGRVYMEWKEYDKAIDCFQRASELSPDLVAARMSLRHAHAAKLRDKQSCGGCGGSPKMTQASRVASTLFLAALLLGPHAVRRRRRRR